MSHDITSYTEWIMSAKEKKTQSVQCHMTEEKTQSGEGQMSEHNAQSGQCHMT